MANNHGPLHAAAGLGRSLFVVLLLLNNAGMLLSPSPPSPFLPSPLPTKIELNFPNIDMNLNDSLGRTPLDYANAFQTHGDAYPALSPPHVILKKRGALETGNVVNLDSLVQHGKTKHLPLLFISFCFFYFF